MAPLESKDTIIVAIELGTSRVSGVAGKRKDGSLQVLAYAEEPTTAQCIKRGLVYNIEKTTVCIRNVISKLESSLRQSISQVYVGIGGQSVRCTHRRVSHNMMTQTKISSDHIDAMCDESKLLEEPDHELVENFPQSYSVDTHLVEDPVGVIGTNVDGEYLNIVARKALVANIETCFSNTDVQIAEKPLAAYELAEYVLTDQEKRAGCVLVNFGAGTTTVVVYKNNIVRHLVTLPIGCGNITQDLMTLQLDEKEAETVKLQYGAARLQNSEEENADSPVQFYTSALGQKIKVSEIKTIIDARLTEIIANVEYQISVSNYADNQQLLGGVVLTGGGAAILNIDKLVQEQLKVEKVRIADQINLSVIKNSNVLNFTTESVKYTSILALLASGNINCVGEKLQSDVPNMFDKAQSEKEAAQRRAEEQRALAKEEEDLRHLEEFKDKMRTTIVRLNSKKDEVANDDSNKKLRKAAIDFASEAEEIISPEYTTLVTNLGLKDKNRQTIREAKDLEEQLKNAINALQKEIDNAQKKNNIWGKFKRTLETVVNGED